MKKVLTIAGSDSSGGAGIQADLKTMTAHKAYGMSVVTALTAQNTTGVYGIFDASPEFVAKQLDCVFSDIFPDAVKIGMVSNTQIIGVIADKLREYNAKNIVVDPVMVSTSESRLLASGAQTALIEALIPLADIITPNIPEAEVLWGKSILCFDDILSAARDIGERTGTAVLVKGGHAIDSLAGAHSGELKSDDVLYSNGDIRVFSGKRINNPNTHGTGCTLSSAIACNLAAGKSIWQSVQSAKEYITACLKAGLDLGKGSGPLDHTAGMINSAK